jgi:penicillin-binding protein 1A
VPANRRTLVVAATVTSLLAPVAVLAVLAVAFYAGPWRALPPERPGPGARITRIYAADGTQLAALRAFETFIPVERDDIPAVLEEAVVAIEDRRFWSHRGVDPPAILRAFWTNFNHGRIVEGGSTITQQYVKQAFLDGRPRTLGAKLREAVLAARVERRLPKDEILHRYLSTVYFGSGAYGVGAAAETYFRVPVSELTLSQAALLAGVIRAPTALDPRSNPTGAERRRLTVLDAMREEGMITPEEHDAAAAERVTLVADGGEGPEGPATLVHPPPDDPLRHPYFVDYVRRYLVARYGEEQVFGGGLRVETSLDPRLQALADEAVAASLAGTEWPLGMALVAVDPGTGLVRALVGGRDFRRSQVNLALGNCTGADPDDASLCLDGGGSGRQPGSAFKPFTLARALEEGIPLTRTYRAPGRFTFPGCRGVGCTVHNAGGGGYGRVTLRTATALSVNTVFAQLIEDVGVRDVAALAHRVGLTMIGPDGIGPDGEPYGPSLTLGAAEVSPLDMASAYGVFAHGGVRVPPSPVVRVIAADGEVLEDNTGRRGRRVLDAGVAHEVADVLEDVVRYGTGTAAALDGPGRVAGKTGTAEDHSDAWFVGFADSLSVAVWMGFADSQRPLVGIGGYGRVYGGTLPAATWAAFMQGALDRPT